MAGGSGEVEEEALPASAPRQVASEGELREMALKKKLGAGKVLCTRDPYGCLRVCVASTPGTGLDPRQDLPRDRAWCRLIFLISRVARGTMRADFNSGASPGRVPLHPLHPPPKSA